MKSSLTILERRGLIYLNYDSFKTFLMIIAQVSFEHIADLLKLD